jgi:hypothetical protein
VVFADERFEIDSQSLRNVFQRAHRQPVFDVVSFDLGDSWLGDASSPGEVVLRESGCDSKLFEAIAE